MDSDWAGLPKHILDSVLERLLPLADYLRFSVVCTSWRCVAKDNRSKRVEMLTLHQPPMLLIPTDKEGTWNLYNVMDDKILDLQLKLPNKRFVGSSKGWLITVEEDFSLSLLNPFSRVEGREEKENSVVRLPQIAVTYDGRWEGEDIDWCVYKAMISADPVSNADDCIAVVIYESYSQMAFLRVGKDTTWTYLDTSWTLIREVIHVEEKFYAVDMWHQLSCFDTCPQSSLDVEFVGGYWEPKALSFVYLVSLSSKELLLVQRFYRVDNGKCSTKRFKIFRWDFDEDEWVEKKTLGDVALFVGDNSSVYVLSSSNCFGCQPNFIYFNCHNRRIGAVNMKLRGHDFGVYDVEKQCVLQPYNTSVMTLMEAAKLQPPIWVTFNANSL